MSYYYNVIGQEIFPVLEDDEGTYTHTSRFLWIGKGEPHGGDNIRDGNWKEEIVEVFACPKKLDCWKPPQKQ